MTCMAGIIMRIATSYGQVTAGNGARLPGKDRS